LEALVAARPAEDNAEESVAEAVFQQAFIPRTLHQVFDVERDVDKVQSGKTEEVMCAAPQ
jgi:RIO kinase 1